MTFTKILAFPLAYFTRRILNRYQPKIIAITGSVGKSSAKEAIALVLGKKYAVRASPKNYNNQIGVPLSVIGELSGYRNIIGWLRVFWRGFVLSFLKRRSDYPRILVLEFGADRTGDIARLAKLAPATIGVLTAITPAHTEFLGSLEKVAAEKFSLLSSLPANGWAVLNIDSPAIETRLPQLEMKKVTYGFKAGADFLGSEVRLSYDYERAVSEGAEMSGGTIFTLSSRGESEEVFICGALGAHVCYAVLAACAVASTLEISLIETVQTLGEYLPPKGRMRLLSGIKRTVLIDDTYNSSPEAVKRALETLAVFPLSGERARRIAVLGDMAELGVETEERHAEVGRLAAELNLDYLVCVGERSRDTARAAETAGLAPEKVVTFGSQSEAGKFVQSELESGDVILIKGSQSSRMEIIVKELLAHPERAEELLVRQERWWRS